MLKSLTTTAIRRSLGQPNAKNSYRRAYFRIDSAIKEGTIPRGKINRECGIKFLILRPTTCLFISFLRTGNRFLLNSAMPLEGTLRVTAARASFFAGVSRNKRNETGNYRRVYFGNEGSGNGKGEEGGGGGRAEEGAADSSSRRKIPEPAVPTPAAAGVESDTYGCERDANRRVCVRRIIRRLRSRNNRPEFRVNRFAADTFFYAFYAWSMRNFRRSPKKK